jgi:hypothetical protein
MRRRLNSSFARAFCLPRKKRPGRKATRVSGKKTAKMSRTLREVFLKCFERGRQSKKIRTKNRKLIKKKAPQEVPSNLKGLAVICARVRPINKD